MQAQFSPSRPVTRPAQRVSATPAFRSLSVSLALVALAAAAVISFAERQGPGVTELGEAMGGEVQTMPLPDTV